MEVINLNLIPTGALPVVHASQYDEGRTFRANLMDGSTVYTLDGTETLECDVKKPDGNIVTVAVTNTSDSYVEIDTTLQMCACAGESLAELHITKGAQEIGTLNFILAVERSPLEGGIESETEIHNLETQIADIVPAVVADQYDSSNVIFDDTPTEGHGIGYAVTSEGIGNAIDNALDMTDTASGAIATFESEYALPLRDLEIEINAVQESGTPTPSSPKLISGFTGANIHVADDENPHAIDNVTAITWQSEAGTVYGGSLDVTTGELTITRGYRTVTSNDTIRLFGSLNSNTVRAGVVTSDMKMPTWNNTSEELDIICNIATPNTDALHASVNAVEGQCCLYKDGSYPLAVFTLPSSCSTTNLALTELVNNGCEYCYPLANPITVQLTPTQIRAIVGTNNVFTDTNGDTSLEYYTKRGEQTVRIAEGVAVDVINNKNIDNLTTTNKTLVGAVNEVNKITDITSDYITMTLGYTFTSGKVYKQGKHIFGNIVLSGTLQGGNNMDTLGTIKSDYRTADPINSFCGISNGQWFTNNIGYVYIASSGGLQVATTPNGMSYAKIHIDYVTA